MSRFVFLFLRLHLFAASSSAVVALAAAQPYVYEINTGTRGTSLIKAFTTLTKTSNTNTPWIGLQTTLPSSLSSAYGSYLGIGANRFIPYIQNIQATTYNTLMIVSYLISSRYPNPQYIVLPTEQVVDLLYFPENSNLPGGNPSAAPQSYPAFYANIPPNTLPFFSIDPDHRASDIISAFSALQKLITNSNLNQIWIQTAIGGPYYPPIPSLSASPLTGTTVTLLQNVSSVTLYSPGLIQIVFKSLNQQTTQSVVVSPEQVQWILFIPNFNSPQQPR